MKVKDRDFEETRFIKTLHKHIQEVGTEKAALIAQRIQKNQPFLVSMLFSFDEALEEDQFDYLLEMIYLIYLFFEDKTDVTKTIITQEMFKAQYELNIQFMNYLNGEEDTDSQIDLLALDLSRIHFKSLYTAVIFLSEDDCRFDGEAENVRDNVLIIFKVLIECMEKELIVKK